MIYNVSSGTLNFSIPYHLMSTLLNIICTLLTQPCWWYRPLDVQRSVTVPPSGFGTCMEQPAVVCRECTIADYVPSRAEERTFFCRR